MCCSRTCAEGSTLFWKNSRRAASGISVAQTRARRNSGALFSFQRYQKETRKKKTGNTSQDKRHGGLGRFFFFSVLFTCAPFLIQTRLQFKMEYTGKKYPLTSSRERRRSEINKRSKGAWRRKLASASEREGERLAEEDGDKERPRR